MQRANPNVRLLELRDLKFDYGGPQVVDVRSLEVEEGTITAVIGPNGCGKTTLFKLINALLEPTAGQVLFAGLDARSAGGRQALREKSVYVHQKPYIFRESVSANVAYALHVRGVAKAARASRISASLAAVGISHLAERQGHALSGGERQRLAIARALALSPALILLDEPTSNIDPESVRIIEAAVAQARDQGVAVLLSTHNLATAYRVADRVLPMTEGRIGENRNNVYRGVLEHEGDSLAHFRFDGGSIVAPALEGEFKAALVPMDDVILSASAVTSSAQNHFSGAVVAIDPLEELVRIELDCGFPLASLVTHAAVDQLDIKPGTRLHASFKASAVRLY
ncbi:MAG: ATP-binding cassette domain-containing protein [Spirochaetales bacterium]